MIDKFNFYDVYGYFLPGGALLLLLWLPYGLVRNSWPGSDWSSAILGVALAYFIGHLLQMICTKVVPSTTRGRYPSAFVLDDDKWLAEAFRTQLCNLVKKKFDLDLEVDKPSTAEDQGPAAEGKAIAKTKAIAKADKARNTAFFLARHVLVQAKEISYGEQFEGLYSLLRGMCAAFTLACSNYIGWSLSAVHHGWLDSVVMVMVAGSLLAGINFSAQVLRNDLNREALSRLEQVSALALLLIAMGIGYASGRRYEVTPGQAWVLALCAMGALLASLRCFGAYKYHCINFALTVWRDFFASAEKEQTTADPLHV
ncbi:MAG TPA: hypothetical protein VE133_11970 [Candidatus Sulfotelmatobacter sp.]|nr:hypothetical protein [Candidatus Sulfotelmatobacter sp.]